MADQNVVFRATNFTGGNNSFRSFSERMDRKERYKQLDALQAKKDAENLRRYNIAQQRLDIQEGRASESHDASMANNEIVRQKNELALEDAKDKKSVQDSFGDVVKSTNTEQADEVNALYRMALEAPNSDAAIEELNEKIVAGYNDGTIDLNQVTNSNQYSQRIRAKLLQENPGINPIQLEQMVKASTSGFAQNDDIRKENLKAGNAMISDAYNDQMAENKTLEKGGEFDDMKMMKTDIVKNLGNPLTDAFDGFQKDKKTGEWKLKGNDEEIGEKEVGKFLSDIKGMDFIVEKAKTVDGKKVPAKTRKLTESEVKEILNASFVDNGMLGGANHIDANQFITLAQSVAERNKDKGRKRKASDIKKEAVRAINANQEKFSKKTGAQKVNDALQLIRKKTQP